MDADERKYIEELAHAVIDAAMEVSNVMGVGFSESVYENSLCEELRRRDISGEQQASLVVRYKDAVVGDFRADLWVERKLIVELKCVAKLNDAHLAQTLNDLKATGTTLALLINFQNPRLEWKHLILNH